jgi:hypothetical protein
VIFSVREEFSLESIKGRPLTGVSDFKELTMTFMAAVKCERITGRQSPHHPLKRFGVII